MVRHQKWISQKSTKGDLWGRLGVESLRKRRLSILWLSTLDDVDLDRHFTLIIIKKLQFNWLLPQQSVPHWHKLTMLFNIVFKSFFLFVVIFVMATFCATDTVTSCTFLTSAKFHNDSQVFSALCKHFVAAFWWFSESCYQTFFAKLCV